MKTYSIPTTEIVLQCAECCVSFGVEVISNPVIGNIGEQSSGDPVIK